MSTKIKSNSNSSISTENSNSNNSDEKQLETIKNFLPESYDKFSMVDSESACDIDLKEEFKTLNCNEDNFYSSECNKFQLKKEIIERNCLAKKENEDTFLYPNLNDKDFNIKIAEKKEFNDTKYDGTIYSNIKEHADLLANAEFELQPHQAFVKNFMSFQTPYNSLLLFHGLGSGKTCSAIGVCEEMRDYMKQMGITKRIIIVASENVQDNFRLQLFDERKLKLIDGIWNIRACTGNKFLQEINPMNMKGLTKEKVINQVKNIINTYYLFLGYGQFANYIIKTINYDEEVARQTKNKDLQRKNEGKKKSINLGDIKIELNPRIIRRLKNEFDNRLIVIDEVHNIRKTDDNENKKVALNLELLVKAVQNMRFLLLSATPMYNSYKEIIWLINLMNINDKRAKIDVKDIFDKNGNFKKNGEEILTRKATGYISFVRGENPYTFPYRVYPSIFSKEHTFKKFNDDKIGFSYPTYQMNLKKIKNDDKNRVLSLYLNVIGDCNNCGECQYCSYKYIIHNLRNKNFKITTKKGVVREMPSFQNMESFGYTLLQTPLESLIISYPMKELKNIINELPDESFSNELSPSFSDIEVEEIIDKNENPGPVDSSIDKVMSEIESDPQVAGKNTSSSSSSSVSISESMPKHYIDPHELTGKKGLDRIMNYIDSKSPPEKGSFEYKKSALDTYGKIFSSELIGKYSSKIKCILDNIYNTVSDKVSEGVILIYSQYIDSGLIPMALALEEMGFTRYGDKTKPLFKNRPSNVVDARTMKPPKDKKNFMPARYSLITGDYRLSPDNDFEVKALTSEDNKEGNRIKIVLISKAGSEGIDLKFIRQVHILEPWYNMNRIEQIIGRAVRNFSHKDLPFEKRNVEIFMYGTILGKENIEEAADLYVYRVAEYKAIQIGKVTRLLKETSVDCIINQGQNNFTYEKLKEKLDTDIVQELSTGQIIQNFKIGDVPFSPSCDYMATCNYDCRPNKTINEDELNEDTYNENYIMINSEKILQKIRMLMKESFFYKKDVLLKAIQTPKEYPYVQIYAALTHLIEGKTEFIVDKYGRNGRLINIGNYYLFQPIEIKDERISIFDRSVPIDYKHNIIDFKINQNIVKPVIDKRNISEVVVEDIESDTSKLSEGKKILDNIQSNFDLAIEFTKPKSKVPRADDNWFKHCGIVMKKLSKDYPEIKNYLLQFIIDHEIDLLLFEEKVLLIDYIYSLKNIRNGSVEQLVKEYFERKIIPTSNLKAIIFYNLNKIKIMMLNENDVWVLMGPEDQKELAKEAKDILDFRREDYNKIIGFMGYEKNNRYLIFKTKDMDSTRDTGARCDEAGKEKTIAILNKIIGSERYNKENTKLIKDSDGNVIQDAMSHTELCVLQELLLRYFDIIKKDDLKWFLTPEMAIYHKLYKVIVKK